MKRYLPTITPTGPDARQTWVVGNLKRYTGVITVTITLRQAPPRP